MWVVIAFKKGVQYGGKEKFFPLYGPFESKEQAECYINDLPKDAQGKIIEVLDPQSIFTL